MQGNLQDQPVSVTHRVLNIEDYVDILRRHRSWIIAPAFLGLVTGVVVAFLQPDTFIASGQLRVVPASSAPRSAGADVSQELSQRVKAISQQIENPASLNGLIQNYNLYPEPRKGEPMASVLDAMRKDIVIGPLTNVSPAGAEAVYAFTLSYAYPDRRLANQVCSDLVSKFVAPGGSSPSSQSPESSRSLQADAAAAKHALNELDSKIAAFKVSNAGRLPDEAGSLIKSISASDSKVTSLNTSISRAGAEKTQLESQLQALQDQLASSNSPGASSDTGSVQRDDRLTQLDSQIRGLESTVATLKETYKETQPDVQHAVALLASKKKERDQYAEKLAALKSDARTGDSAAESSQSRELQARVTTLQAAVQAKDLQLEKLNRQLDSVRRRSGGLRQKVETSPLGRSAYAALMRDREAAEQRYEDLERRAQQTSMVASVAARGQGETFEVLEQPVTPAGPAAPKRPLIIAIATAAGLLLGLGIAFGRELKDVSLKSLKDVGAYTRLAILGTIPLLEKDYVIRKRRRMNWLVWSASLLLGVLIMSGAVIYHYTARYG